MSPGVGLDLAKEIPEIITAGRALEFHDVGALIGQQLPGVVARKQLGRLDDPHPFQQTGHVRPPDPGSGETGCLPLF